MASLEVKFVCRDEVSKLMEESVDSLRNYSLFSPDSSFHPSQITECPRRLIYRVNGTSAGMYVGNSPYESVEKESFKNKWLALLEKVKSVKILHKDAIASDCNYNLYSIVDAVINIKGDIFAVKAIQTYGDEMDEVRNKGAMKKHVIEMVLNIWLLEVDGGILIYDSKENYGHCMFHIKPYKPIVESVTEKCKKLCNFKLMGQMPNRPYKSKAYKECIACEYRGLCWENKKEDKKTA